MHFPGACCRSSSAMRDSYGMFDLCCIAYVVTWRFSDALGYDLDGRADRPKEMG